MLINILLGIAVFILTTILFIKVYISEDDRYDIYCKMEEKEGKHLEGKPTAYKVFYQVVFNLL